MKFCLEILQVKLIFQFNLLISLIIYTWTMNIYHFFKVYSSDNVLYIYVFLSSLLTIKNCQGLTAYHCPNLAIFILQQWLYPLALHECQLIHNAFCKISALSQSVTHIFISMSLHCTLNITCRHFSEENDLPLVKCELV